MKQLKKMLLLVAVGSLVLVAGCTSQQAGAAVCGNGAVEAGEGCDDGNRVSGDGCSAACQSETAGAAAPPPIPE